ncbi:hypothetical protein X975_23114, partial [Stegodyphus mimosarum]
RICLCSHPSSVCTSVCLAPVLNRVSKVCVCRFELSNGSTFEVQIWFKSYQSFDELFPCAKDRLRNYIM